LEPDNDRDILSGLSRLQISARVENVEELGVRSRVVDAQIARSGILKALDGICGRASSKRLGCVSKFRLKVFGIVFSDLGEVTRENESRDCNGE
jgi:hypothetical protein